ncbi:hypothetical protein IMCC3317_41180 [Kordia antarctica]|uniref:Uncharacterized protein n=1 Tax=Kordia antarctica TaxID=1218801 RepID=A0A7L4ZSJ6_9FLAO|nr:hypothetical protein [Kordia antarctica]QHI38724.1 hypothetical protein IMCC3317_41180 [Kordia antarctica]
MSKKRIKKIIATHIKNKNYVKISRGFKNDVFSATTGYILTCSNDFILIAENDEFRFIGFNCIPIKVITNIRCNKNDEYYGMVFEKEFPKKFKKITKKDNIIDITSFETIFKNLLAKKECVIVECERKKHNYFSIGSIQKISSKNVTIEYFNAQGFLEEPNKSNFKQITKITYQDNYSNTFKKYIRS